MKLVKQVLFFFLFALCLTARIVAAEPTSFTKVGVTTITFFDDLRKRPLITEVWYPLEKSVKSSKISGLWQMSPEARDTPFVCKNKKLPLIVMSHDDGGGRDDLAWMGEFLAGHGYIVASVDHYGDTWYLNQPKEALRRWERPKDVSIVIEKMLEDLVFGQCIDDEKIGFIGYGLGGLTGIWLAGGQANLYPTPSQANSSEVELSQNSDQDIINSIPFSKAKKIYKDSRIKAEFLMAPSYGFAFNKAGLETISIPIYIVAGASDDVAPVEKNAKFYAQSIKSAQLQILPGKVGHYVFFPLPTEKGKKFLPPRIIQDETSVDRYKIHEEVERKALQFFDKELQQ